MLPIRHQLKSKTQKTKVEASIVWENQLGSGRSVVIIFTLGMLPGPGPQAGRVHTAVSEGLPGLHGAPP